MYSIGTSKAVTVRLLEQTAPIDENEMAAIKADKQLVMSLKAGSADVKKGQYTIVRNRRDRRISKRR